MKKFPKKVYMRWEGEEGLQYLIGYPDISDTADGEVVKFVGIYQLVSEAEVRQPTQYRPKGTKSWSEAK